MTAVNEEAPDLDFNEPLGAAQGAVAYSNLDDYYFSGEKGYFAGVYTGYKYQCVEYSRRHMLIHYGCIFGQCGPAYELYGHKSVEHVETGETLKWVACDNKKTTVRPAPGMTIIYPLHKKMPVGHVCTIGAVGDDWVGIAEQNQESKAWVAGQPYGRKVPLTKGEDGAYSLIETDPALVDCLGWLYIDGAKERAPSDGVAAFQLASLNEATLGGTTHAPLKVLDKFLAKDAHVPSKLSRFATQLSNPASSIKKQKPAQTEEEKQKEESAHDKATAAFNARKRDLIEHYNCLLLDHFEAQKREALAAAAQHHHSVASPTTTLRRRAATARLPFWHSVYAPNEPLAIGSIGATHRAFLVIERAAKHILKPAMEDDGAAAARLAQDYDMPVALLRAAAAHLNGALAASVQLSAGEFIFGTLCLHFDESSQSFRVVHADFDSVNYVIDVHGIQEQHTRDHGLSAGWQMTTFGNDVHRAVRNIQRSPHYGLGKNEGIPLTFVDFGDAESLKRRGAVFASKEQEYEYTVERINQQYLFVVLEQFIRDKAHDLSLGDLPPEDMPQWTVTKVDFFDDAVTVDEGAKCLAAGGKKLAMLWKMAPWWALFDAAKGVGKVAAFLSHVAPTNDVFQPLWTHIVGHRRFLRAMALWAEEHDRACTDGESASQFTIPSACFKEDGGEACTYRIPAFDGETNPHNPMKGDPAEDLHVYDAKSHAFFAATQCLVGGGKRSAAVMIEGRSADAEQKSCSIDELVHPAPLSFMPFLWRPAEGEDKKEEEA